MEEATVRLAALDRALAFAAQTGLICTRCITDIAQEFDAFLSRGESVGTHLTADVEIETEQGDLFEDNIIPLGPTKKH